MHTNDAIGPSMAPPGISARRWAMVTFLVLFAMNLLDYVDRWVLAAVLPQIQAELHLNNAQAGWLPSLFLVSYSLVSPFMGYAGDPTCRTWLLGAGVTVCGLA